MDEKEAIKTGSELVSQHGGLMAWGGAMVTVIGGWFTNRAKVAEIDRRLKDVEGRFLDDQGRPILLSVADMKNICRDKQAPLLVKLGGTDSTVQELKGKVEGIDGKVDQIVTDLAVIVAVYKERGKC